MIKIKILKLLNFFFSFLKKQLFVFFVFFCIYIFYFKKTIGVAFNSSQPSALNFLLGKPSQSFLDACTTTMDVLAVSIILSGSYLIYNYLTAPIIIEPKKIELVEKLTEVENVTPGYLSESQVSSNLLSENLISSFDSYQEHLNDWRLKMLSLKSYFGEPLAVIIYKYEDIKEDLCEHILKHCELHKILFSYINPTLKTSGFKERTLIPITSISSWNRDINLIDVNGFEYCALPNLSGVVPLKANAPLTFDTIAKLCKVPLEQIGCLDYHWAICERLNQTCGPKFIAINPIVVPENVITNTIEKIPSTVVVDAVVGTRLGYFFLEVKKFIFSFFF